MINKNELLKEIINMKDSIDDPTDSHEFEYNKGWRYALDHIEAAIKKLQLKGFDKINQIITEIKETPFDEILQYHLQQERNSISSMTFDTFKDVTHGYFDPELTEKDDLEEKKDEYLDMVERYKIHNYSNIDLFVGVLQEINS